MKKVTCIRLVCFLSMVIIICGFFVFTYSVPVQADKNNALTGKLNIMVNKTEEEMRPYEEMFKRRYPGVELNYIYLENYEEQAKKMIESGDYADALFVPGSIPSDKFSDYFEVLGDSSELSHKYNFIEQSKRIGSKVYGIPSYAYTSGFLYNKSVFQKAGITELPENIEEFMEDLRNIKEYTDAVPFYTNYVSDWAMNVWETYPFIDMTGDADYKQNVFVNEKNPYSDGSTHDTVYRLLYDIVKEGLCEENVGVGDWEKSKALLNEGKIGCIAIGSWALNQFKNAGDYSDDVAFMPFPNKVNGKKYSTITTDYCYAINSHSKNKEAAKAYIFFMLNESGYALDNDTLSIVKTDPYPTSYSDMKNVTLISNNIASPNNNGKYEKLSSKLNLTDGKEQKRIIESAAGLSKESLDDIFADWNKRWESSRTSDMATKNEIASFSKDELATDKYKVDFSDTELAYIKEVKTIKVGYLRKFAPFQYEKSGKFNGVAAEVCKIISKQTGITFEYHPYDNYHQLVEAINSNSIDMISGIESISSFSDSIRMSKEYLEFTNVLVKNKSTDVDGIDKKYAAVVRGNESDYFYGLSNIIYSNTFPDTINKINKLKADYTITNYYSANYYIREGGYNNVAILPMTSKNGMYLGFSKNSDQRLIAICNKCIYSIPASKIELMLLDSMDPPLQAINLKRFIEIYPMQSFLCLTGVFASIILIILWVYKEKEINSKKHELDVKRYEILADLADEYVFEYNCEKNSLIFDKKFYETFDFGGEVKLDDYKKDNKELNLFIKNFIELREQDDMNNKVFLYEHNDGKMVWYRLIVSKIYDDNQNLIQMIGKIVNVQNEMEERQEIIEKAERDPLTGLFNREGFHSVFHRLQENQKHNGRYGMAVLDLDDFKGVNDTLGHAGGDIALKMLADKLTAVFTDHGITARYGGDEFIIYIPNVQTTEEVNSLLSSIVRKMDRVIIYQKKERKLSISLGAVIVDNIESMEEAFNQVDNVLYEVKQLGKNSYRLIEK